MTREEKMKALFEFCEGTSCDKCPMGEFSHCDISKYTDDEINRAYDLIVPQPLSASPSPTIKDSGNRRAFESGAVRDMSEGKGRMDLLPWAAIMEVSKHCENGAKKYGEHNVDKGIPTHSLCDSAARHLAKYLDGWNDEPHLLAAAWNLLWAIQMEIKHPEMVDTPFVQNNETKCPYRVWHGDYNLHYCNKDERIICDDPSNCKYKE